MIFAYIPYWENPPNRSEDAASNWEMLTPLQVHRDQVNGWTDLKSGLNRSKRRPPLKVVGGSFFVSDADLQNLATIHQNARYVL